MALRVIPERTVRALAERWYPSLVDVMDLVITQSPSGQEVRSHPQPLAGHTDIRAHIKPLDSAEQVGPEGTVTTGDYIVKLDGHYPSITESMELLDQDNQRYEITDVMHHGSGVQTRLRAHIRTPRGVT